MALIDELLKQVGGDGLRDALAKEVDKLRQRKAFGLVFEKHIPELAVVADAPIRPGMVVQRRDRPEEDIEYVVDSVTAQKATVRSFGRSDSSSKDLPLRCLAVAKHFGKPIFPGLRLVDQLSQSDSRPVHPVINGENFHVLQLLTIFGEAFVDCIYLDPPYNTGSQDWKYNNRFVDKNDRWRHSKWLSFMERRLQFAKRLLKPDGVLVISIDENEHAHLCCLLGQIFVGWDITSVAIIHNPRGIQGDNFSITNDFAVFVTPPGAKVISPRKLTKDAPRETRFQVWGDQSKRTQAKNCFYPIYVEDDVVVGFGDVPPKSFHPDTPFRDLGNGRYEVWPIDNAGIERKWRNERKTVEGVAHLLRPEWIRDRLQIRIDKDTAMHKSVWSGSLYDAGSHGKRLLTKIFGVDFDYPKSIYTMRDILYACTGVRKNAVILDYMAGSGTTLHATWLLNAADGGSRQCILVTNNEVGAKVAAKLHKEGKFIGDAAYEKHGIFQAVTVPRCKAALTGMSANGKPAQGQYDGGRARAKGFEENVAFFDLVYLDSDDVELGRAFDQITPALWFASGARSKYEVPRIGPGFIIDPANGYAVLFDDAMMTKFEEAMVGLPEITQVFHSTNAPDAFAELVVRLGAERNTHMLYRDYLSRCRSNASVAS